MGVGALDVRHLRSWRQALGIPHLVDGTSLHTLGFFDVLIEAQLAATASTAWGCGLVPTVRLLVSH